MHPPSRPVFIFDGDCEFCKGWVERWRARTDDAVEFRASPDERFPEIGLPLYAISSVFLEKDGSVFVGSEAIFQMLKYAPGQGHWLWLYQNAPGFAFLSEKIYRAIAGNRSTMSRLQEMFSLKFRKTQE